MAVEANHPTCVICAARTRASTGFVCEPHKLGQSNNRKRYVFGRTHKTGTTMRPLQCPHPEHKVQTVASAQGMLRKLLNK